jgi:hypothetical protein
MELFLQLQNNYLPLHRLNFGIITLSPKKKDASRIDKNRPICLLNVIFKIFRKVGTNIATEIAHKVMKPTQTNFIHGRNILEGVVILNEIVHEPHTKMDGVLFKIDF